MKKVELLAPAGDYKAFQGAIHAGADAVYLGGPRFGARAYAQNFTEEEVCKAIRYAHLFGRKVYLTLNTLMKETEMEQLYDYLLPYYCTGLDGVIVQDMGVVRFVRRQFPDMELHISTQAAVTGRFGAKLMKEAGAVRIVPARELSLQEIRHIKEETGLEIETFIHGSVCYCYSGLCLFSSTLGGRSGNRGRCAQPCRLPYSNAESGKQELYPLSLKDMCTVEHIPQLIEAGIDSFKIEGRMKKAEYAAGVTAIYRKYIDRYYENPNAEFQVEAKDLEKLRSLYIRSELQDGYYFRHNGKEMVTLKQPGYAGNDEALLGRIREKYLEQAPKLQADLSIYLEAGKEAVLTASCKDTTVSVSGMEVQAAQKRPLTKEDVKKQLAKTGDTAFSCSDTEIQIEINGDIFLPVSALNELRRSVFEALEQALLGESERAKPKRLIETEEEYACAETAGTSTEGYGAETEHRGASGGLRVEVFSTAQALAVLRQPGIGRLYLPAESFVCAPEKEAGIGSVLAQAEVYKQENPDFTLYMALPHIFRERSEQFMDAAYRNLSIPQVDGVLVRNLEEAGWLIARGYQGAVQTDAALYIWNREAERFWGKMCSWNNQCQFCTIETTLPLELSRGELKMLERDGRELIVYGRTPLMITANCVRKTMASCQAGEKSSDKSSDKRKDFTYLTDRYRKNFPVWTNCEQCYNVIYNSVPTSLHTFLNRRKNWGRTAFRIVLTTEEREETERIIRFFGQIIEEKDGCSDVPFTEYTSGYFKRGVE